MSKATTYMKVMEAKNPQQAMLAIANTLDRLEAYITGPEMDPWQGMSFDRPLPVEPDDDEPHKRSPEWVAEFKQEVDRLTRETLVLDSEDGTTDVVIPGVTEEKMERRRQFERQALKLGEHLGNVEEDWTEAYAKGGPRWLYYANRDLVMSYPDATKSMMIEDIIEDSPQEAHEIGRDLLKQPCETGPGSVAMRVADGDVG